MPSGHLEVGKVSIRVIPNMDGFKKRVEQQVKRLGPVRVKVQGEGVDKLQRQVDKAAKDRVAKVKVAVDADNLKNQITKAASSSKVKFNADTTNLKRELDSWFKDASKQLKLRPSVEVDGESAARGLRKVSQVEPIKLDVDDRSVKQKIQNFGKRLRDSVSKTGGYAVTRQVVWSLGGDRLDQQIKKWRNHVKHQAEKTVIVRSKVSAQIIPETKHLNADDVKRIRRELQQMMKDMRKIPELQDTMFRGPKSGNHIPELRKLYNDLRKEVYGLKLDKADNPVALEKTHKQLDIIAAKMRDIHTKSRASNASFDKMLKDLQRNVKTPALKALRDVEVKTFKRKADTVKPDKTNKLVEKLKKELYYAKYNMAAKQFERSQKINNIIKNYSRAFEKHTPKVRRYGDAVRGAWESIAQGVERASRRMDRSVKQVEKTQQRSFKRRKGLRSVDELGTQKFAGLSRIGWIIAAISSIAGPVISLVSGAVAALPALGLAAGAALGAVVLGFEGIKEAAQAAQPAIANAKEVLSGTFKQRLTPQFEKLGEVLFKITPALDKVAHGISDFTAGIVDAHASGEGIRFINKTLGNTAKLFSKMSPFAHDFTSGLLEMGAAGSETFTELAEGMNRFGSTFKNAVKELSDSGELQQAIESTYKVLGSAGMNIGRIIRAGIEEFTPQVAQSVDNLFTGFADGVIEMLPSFNAFASTAFDVVGTLFDELGDVFKRSEDNLQTIFTNLGPGLSDLVRGIGDVAAPVLEIVTNALANLSPGAGDVLSSVGNALTRIGSALEESHIDEHIGNLFSMLSKDLEGGASWIDKAATGIEKLIDMYDKVDKAFQSFTLSWFTSASDIDFAIKNMFSSSDAKHVFDAVGKINMRMDYSDVDKAAQEATSRLQKVGDGIKDVELKAQVTTAIEDINSAESVQDIQNILNSLKYAINNDTDARELRVKMGLTPEVEVTPVEGVAEQANAELQASMSGLGEGMGEAAQSALDGKAVEIGDIAQAQAAETAALVGEAFGNMEIPTEGLTTSISTALTTLQDDVVLRTTEIGTQLESSLQEIPNSLSVIFDGMGPSISTALTGVTADVSTNFETITSTVTSSLSGIETSVSGSFQNLAGVVSSTIAPIAGDVSSTFDSVKNSITTAGQEAESSFTDAMQTMQTNAISAATSTADGVRNALTMDLTGSGQAAGNSFAAGLRSTAGNAAAAASEVAAAARAYFPNSPAKEGPFSGTGYVDRSGMAIGRDFAQGLVSQVRGVGQAAHQLTGAAHDAFSNIHLPLENFHRNKVLRPVLEANAKKIADWRKRQEESAQKTVEKIDKINDSKKQQVDKEQDIAKAREEAAQKDAESYQKMLESLEAPDYSKINRSIQSYWIDGTREMLQQGLQDAVNRVDLAGGIRNTAMGAINGIRSVFGDNPVLADVEANVNAEHFAWSINKVIEESEIAEIPVNFAIANLQQLKNDLGMGDGVVSRVIDQALKFDPNNTDSNRYAQQASKTEVHYHVADMNEAIRLEELRRRKEALKSR